MAFIFRSVITLALSMAIVQSEANAQVDDAPAIEQTKSKADAPGKAKAQPESKLPKNVASLLKTLPKETEIGIVVLDRRGRMVFQHNSELELPAASSVKSILLLECLPRSRTTLTPLTGKILGKS